MRTIILHAYKDESTGSIGLGMAGMNIDETTNSSTNGIAIAHDIMEHINGPEHIGDIADELEALGALWYVRGQWGDITRKPSAYTPAESIAGDITNMFREHVDGKSVDMTCPRSRTVYGEDGIQEILNHADATWQDQFSIDELPIIYQWRAYRDIALRRLRIGYSKARRRWERHGRFAANNAFWAIVDACEPIATNLEYEGQRYKLRCVNGEATCTEIYDDE